VEKPSMKKYLVMEFADAPNMDLKSGKVGEAHFFTSFGVISGRSLDNPGEVSDKSTASELFAKHAAEIYQKEYCEENTGFAPGNDGYVVLVDVTIRTITNQHYYMPSMVLFYDQIIGMTLGDLSESGQQGFAST